MWRGRTEIHKVNDVKACTVPILTARPKDKAFDLFVSQDALNIDGLSEATLEEFIQAGFIHEYGYISIWKNTGMPIVREMEGSGTEVV